MSRIEAMKTAERQNSATERNKWPYLLTQRAHLATFRTVISGAPASLVPAFRIIEFGPWSSTKLPGLAHPLAMPARERRNEIMRTSSWS